jgi:DME family drug/metabolite transporter
VDGWAFAVAVGVLSTALAYVAFLTGLKTVAPFVATIVILLEPLVATVLGAVVLGEQLGPVVIIGGLVLGSAVVLLRPQRDEPESIH